MEWIKKIQLCFKSGLLFSGAAQDRDAPLMYSIQWT